MTGALFADLRLPLVCAPMSFASSLPLTLACMRAGVVAGWQGGNVRTADEFEAILTAIVAEPAPRAPPLVNLPARIVDDPDLGAAKLRLCERHRVPLIMSSVGDPTALVARAHGWGGRVIHDATTLRHAEKALDAGVDGLMLTCAGAGGHSGMLSPFAFVPAVRARTDGLIIAGGGIASAAGIAAALALGADLACMGTRFIATQEAGAVAGHKAMIANADMADIMMSDVINGIPANWIRQSIAAIGLDPVALPAKRGPMRGAEMPAGVRPWRDVWSAGHSVGLIDDVPGVADLVDRLAVEFSAPARDWRQRLLGVFS
ncbi:MAG: NAD(P)H-dependent flavin oxidoreductase [Polymorphobacter sp.]